MGTYDRCSVEKQTTRVSGYHHWRSRGQREWRCHQEQCGHLYSSPSDIQTPTGKKKKVVVAVRRKKNQEIHLQTLTETIQLFMWLTLALNGLHAAVILKLL